MSNMLLTPSAIFDMIHVWAKQHGVFAYGVEPVLEDEKSVDFVLKLDDGQELHIIARRTSNEQKTN